MTSGRFRSLVTAGALATWALVALGGVVRVSGSGLGCPHWPLCTAEAVPLDQRASIIEYSHRVLVALVSVFAVAIAVWAWRSYRQRRDVLWPALGAVALIPVQAILGAIAVWTKLAGWVVAVHFLVGLVLLATMTLIACAAWRGAPGAVTEGFARLTSIGALAGALVLTLGAVVVATNAEDACGTQWPACKGGLANGGSSAQLQVAHRSAAYLLAAIALALFILAMRGSGPRVAGALPLLACLMQISIGVAMVLSGPGDSAYEALEGLHVAGAGAVWGAIVALAALAHRNRAPAAPSAPGEPLPAETSPLAQLL